MTTDRLSPPVTPPEGGQTRRGLFKCLAWAGTGIVWSVAGGVPRGFELVGEAAAAPAAGFTFVQISDSHIGFKGEVNPDPAATLQEALQRIAGLPVRPALIVHTGDVTPLSKPAEFDTAQEILKGARRDMHFVPGEHDTFVDNGKAYLDRFGQGSTANGWRSFDFKGVHFVGLVNVWNLKAGGFGVLGDDQLAWLKKDVEGLSASTPVVVYAHVPLWAVYPSWGWGTSDAEQALTLLRRFGSVTVLNGHIHQVLQKVEGNITFHTAASTAFPQPAPGDGPAPGPLRVVPEQLLSSLGVRQVLFVQKAGAPVIVDAQLV